MAKSKNKFHKYKGLIVCSAVILIAGLTAFYYKDYIELYYINYRFNTFKPGDKLYTADYNKDFATHPYDIDLQQLIRPINEQDVDVMNIELYKKAIIKSNLNFSKKPYVDNFGWRISGDSLRKAKTAYIGTYVGYKILNYQSVNKTYRPMIYYIIKADKRFLYQKDPEEYVMYKIPDDYVEANSSFYIPCYEGINKEPEFLRKK